MKRSLPVPTEPPDPHYCPEIVCEVVPDRGIWSLRFPCPWCSTTRRPVVHQHGGGRLDHKPLVGPRWGHRVTHCTSISSPTGYILIGTPFGTDVANLPDPHIDG
jgi:hypothetical protein